MIALLRGDLVRDEGIKLKPYTDTRGHLTIGVGRNLDSKGVSYPEAMSMLDRDIDDAEMDLDREVPWWRNLPEPAQRGFANMSFNLGWPTLSKFRNMLSALEAHDFKRAAVEALYSRWATQVGERAYRIAELYRSCIGIT